MKAATIKEIKQAMESRTPAELVELCLRLARFKKENKELLTYLLFELPDEAAYIESVKAEVSGEFERINTDRYYYMKKSVRKALRVTQKYIRYSRKKETEVELLLHFCSEMKALRPSIFRNTVLRNLYERQLASVRKTLLTMHEDLQYDYQQEIGRLRDLDQG